MAASIRNPIKTVILDLDGTLIDSAPTIAAALNQVIADRGGKAVALDQVKRLVSRGASEMVRICLGECATTPEADLLAFRKVYGALSPNPSHLYPGAANFIEMMSALGLGLAICTNKPQSLSEQVLAAVGLTPFFKAIVGGVPELPAKPSPAMVLRALELTGARPESAVFVGDSEIDAEAARAARVPFLLVEFGYPLGPLEAIPAQFRSADFRGLESYLSEWVSDAAD